jgi:hypothetical protein
MKQHHKPEDPRALRAQAAWDLIVALMAWATILWAVFTLGVAWRNV